MSSTFSPLTIPSGSAWSNWHTASWRGQGREDVSPLRFEDLHILTMPGQRVEPFTSPSPAQLQVREMLRHQGELMEKGLRPKVPRSVTVLKARKLGISTEAQAQAFLMIANRPNTEALVISHEAKSASILFGMSERFYRCLPPAKKPKRRFLNRRVLAFDEPSNSSLTIDVMGEGAGRSGTYRFVHISELAQCEADGPGTLVAVRGSMPVEPDCIEIIESTGFGQGGCFFSEYYMAKDRGEAIFSPWWAEPRYQLELPLPEEEWTDFERTEARKYGLSPNQVAWMRYAFEKKTSDQDVRSREAQFRQEFPGCEDDAFQGKARGVFDRELIEMVNAHVRKGALDHVFTRSIPGCPHELLRTLRRIDETPQSAFVIGVDPSEGLEGGDRAGVVVVDRVTGQCVAQMASGHDTEQLARSVFDLGLFYNRAWVVVERNGPGHRVLSALRERDYPRLWSERQTVNRLANISPKLGWGTTRGSKMQAIGSLIGRLRGGRITIPFQEILDEMRVYLYDKTGKPGAVSGCHDDLISALIIACAAGDELGVSDPVMEDLARMKAIRTGDVKWRRGDVDLLVEMQYGYNPREDE